MECGGKGAAGDTALDIPELRNVLGRLGIQSGVDAYPLPPHSKSALDTLIRERDLNFLVQRRPASNKPLRDLSGSWTFRLAG